ncbi:MAG: hypothetical protein AB1516_07840 [Pseudomonadota bacterium]
MARAVMVVIGFTRIQVAVTVVLIAVAMRVAVFMASFEHMEELPLGH